MCHVLTVFTFHRSVSPSLNNRVYIYLTSLQAKYAYKAIAEFAKHVIDGTPIDHPAPAFPELKIETTTPSEDGFARYQPEVSGPTEQLAQAANAVSSGVKELSSSIGSRAGLSNESKSSQHLYEDNKATLKENIQEQPDLNRVIISDQNRTDERREGSRTVYLHFSDSVSYLSHMKDLLSNVVMVRERVDIRGRVRQMESLQDIPCLRLKPKEIGMLKEAPARRWLTGQQEWDERFRGTAKKVAKKRRKNEETYQKIIDRARELGLIHADDAKSIHSVASSVSADGEIQQHRRWGPLDLENEKPPDSAIAGRRDTVSKPASSVSITSNLIT